MVIVPCTPGGQSSWVQRTTLDGVDYLLTFQWSQRAGHWYLSLSDADSNPIASGRLITTSWRLLRGVNASNRPPGDFVCVDTLGDGWDPGFSDLGDRFLLLYGDPSDFTGGN